MPEWAGLQDARIFITGGTGFLGTWLLETLIEASGVHGLGARVVVLTRSPDSFRAREPRLAMNAAIELWPGDVRRFVEPEGSFTHIIHGAAEPARADARDTVDTICRGAERVVDFARRRGAGRMLFISSGAVYGSAPASMRLIPETLAFDSATPGARSAYGEAKRMAESVCLSSGLDVTIARGFAFLGPRMPLDGPYAAGNFLRDALDGRDIEVRGDGSDVRSYMYIKDCAEWLWTILLRGDRGSAYNVGSDHAITITELAQTIAACAPNPVGVRVLAASAPGVSRRYVPSIRKARTELHLEVNTPLEVAIHKTLSWYRGLRAEPTHAPS